MIFSQKNKGIKELSKVSLESNIFFGFSEWKRDFIKKIFGNNCYFFTTQDANSNEFFQLFKENFQFINDIYVWSYSEPYWLSSFCIKKNRKFYRVEDGFIRSSDLGLNKSIPKSLIFDDSGMLYFDAARESKLHYLIRNTLLSNEKIIESRVYINKIVKNNLSKYNLHTFNISRDIRNAILIIGQNESDMSIVKSGAVFTTNETLIKHVMSINPDRLIIYKPHPDTIHNEKNRKSYPENLDGVLVIDNLHYLFDNVSNITEVHTISSLLGFEFLMRGLRVHCYSRTWYSGWGLTEDTYISKDKIYNRTVDELFYCAYILYPSYYNTALNNTSIGQTLNSLLDNNGQ